MNCGVNAFMKTVSIIDLDLAREVLANNAFVQALYEDEQNLMDDVLLNLHGDSYRERREVVDRFFQSAKVDNYVEDSLPAILTDAYAAFDFNATADLVELSRFISVSIAADLVGIELDRSNLDQVSRLAWLTKRFVDIATLVHSNRHETEIRQEVDVAFEEFYENFYSPSLAKLDPRKQQVSENLILRYLRYQPRLKLSDDTMLREMVFLLHSSFGPLHVLLTNAVHESLMWIEAGENRLSALRTDKKLVAACVRETARLHPISPVAWRRSTDSIRLSNGLRMEPGDFAVIDLSSTNNDSDAFGDKTHTFNPVRHLRAKTCQSGLTFGYGLHQCPASRLVVGKKNLEIDAIGPAILHWLFNKGITQDKNTHAKPDGRTQRAQWRNYPIRFKSPDVLI